MLNSGAPQILGVYDKYDHLLQFDLVNTKNKELYHYTNIYGLFGIITNKSLWLTRSDFLNDSTEITYFNESNRYFGRGKLGKYKSIRC